MTAGQIIIACFMLAVVLGIWGEDKNIEKRLSRKQEEDNAE